METGVTTPKAGLRPPMAVGLSGLAVGMAAVVALLVSMDLWYVAIILLASGPGFYLLHRYPFAAVMIWVAVAPILMSGEGGIERRIYWLIHRALPVGTLLTIVVARWIGVRKDRLPKLGWPEAFMGGYLLLTIISIAYRSPDMVATYVYMYDHVLVPMSIYLLVRLLVPKEAELRRLVPALAFLLLFQTAVGIVEWLAPEVLPSSWPNRENRASGTVRHPNVFAVTVLFAGLYLAHYGRQIQERARLRPITGWLLGVAVVMAIATLSRASWLAAAFVLVGLFFIYRKLLVRVVMFFLAAAIALSVMGGLPDPVTDLLGTRAYSEASAESALSRLPVVIASLRMIEARPFVGWGYENFDRYDHSFVSSIEGLYVPDKDHASHNFFLTLGAESGLLGLLLYVGPLLWCLVKTPLGRRELPVAGLRSRKLMAVLWVAMGAQFIVYNISNNRVAFGLGLWWLTVGLLVSTCDWRESAADQAESDLQRQVAAVRSNREPAWRLPS